MRVSFLGSATDADVDRFLRVLSGAVADLREGAVADLREMVELDAQAVEREARR